MNPITGLNIGRIVIGVLAFFTPRLLARVLRLDAANQPQLTYLSRMFGSREVVVGAVTLSATGTSRTNLVLVGVAVDAADAVAGIAAGANKSVSKPTAAMLTLPALAAVAAGVYGLSRKG
ncbi:hypothetical protein [Nocardioides sp. AE5]|uniref:hypothetical protein n=1 Tax=Nocardioides sp. AE5 TaxID=2962573 RepID=UPI002882BD70|nr:hypothetical protein [Nocardioides sp. AE5]MDT0203602.1 hypothetical protein [Nocardioides sp. AE5]